MAATDADTGMIRRDERQRDPNILDRTQQVPGVTQLEGESEQRRDRTEHDVPLLPVEADAQHLAAFMQAMAHQAGIGNRARVRTGLGPGQREAGNILPGGKPGQMMLLLLLGAVMQQQFGRSERVRHHHRDRAGRAAGGEFHDHLAMGKCREPEPAIASGNDDPEEPLLADKAPGCRRQIVQFMRNPPLVEHFAQHLHRPIEEGTLFRRERRGGKSMQAGKVGPAAEQFALPPHRVGVERLLLGPGYPRS